MKKILTMAMIGILTFTIFSNINITAEKIQKTSISFNFSDFKKIDLNENTKLTINGADSTFIKDSYFQIPTITKTLYFPFNANIINIECSTGKIYNEMLTKPISITPKPVLLGFEKYSIKSDDMIKKYSIDYWFDYEIGMGIHNNERNIIK
jgi:hypothetical protein